MALSVTKGRKFDAEELAHEIIISLYSGDREKLTGLIARKQLRYWIARMMLNQYNSNSSPFHYKYRKPAERHRNATHDIKGWSEDDLEAQKIKEELHTFVEEELAGQPYFERTITEVYFNHEHSLNSLARATGISRTTLYKAIKSTKNAIKEKYQEN
jgi:DNA-directed RNA polymerase specialized sigma24 family protein